MAPRPVKRLKRSVVLSSEDEEPLEEPKKQQKKIDLAKKPAPTRSKRQNASVSTKKKTGNLDLRQSTKNQQPKDSTRKISAFFATAEIPGDAKGRYPPPTEYQESAPAATENEEHEDIIEDISDDNESNELGATQHTTRLVLDRRKLASNSDDSKLGSPRKTAPPNGSQKFLLRNNAIEKLESKVAADIESQEPWVERFPPVNLEELAVHKKKVSDVQSWLESVLSRRAHKRLLVIKGPAGAGKTTTLKMLAKDLQLAISEWKNPMGSQYASEGYVSMSAHFEDFLGRTGKFNSLEFDNLPNEERIVPIDASSAQKIVLIEEFPNIAVSSSTSLFSFRSSILQFLASRTPPTFSHDRRAQIQNLNVTPLVLIITETRLTSTTTPSDVFTAHRLLGSEILNHPAVSIIEFNPVASTFTKKALDLVVRKEAQFSGRRRTPGPSAITRLCEIGDVRSAISSLEFLCVKSQDNDDWGGSVAPRKQRGAKATSTLTTMEKDSLETICLRENSIGLFHAVGKVVYNKRIDPTLESTEASMRTDIVQPPDHLQEHSRLRQPETYIDKLIDETGTDVDTFIAALHENYVMSCEGPKLVDALDGCLAALSDSDLLSTSRGSRSGQALFATSSETLRRDEIAFQLAVRGLLFALPCPVKRSTHPTRVHGRQGGKVDSHKMFYPASMRLWRQTEQIEESIEHWCRHSRKTMTSSSKPIKRDHQPSEPDEFGGLDSDFDDQSPLVDQHQRHTEPIRTSLASTKTELVLERLPYVTKMERAKHSSKNLSGLESITQFHGIDLLRDDVSEDEQMDPSTNIAASGIRSVIQQSRKETTEGHVQSILPIEEEVGKLYLSEDDIED